MRFLIVFAALAAAMVATPTKAESLKAGYPICVSQEMLGQMYDAILAQDAKGVDYLMGHGCLTTTAGLPVSVLKRDLAEARIRVYARGVTAEGWVSIGAIAGLQP